MVVVLTEDDLEKLEMYGVTERDADGPIERPVIYFFDKLQPQTVPPLSSEAFRPEGGLEQKEI